ncbi:Predicted transcriptional regulator [Streptococcus suis 05ZYH33]|nr:Predicted transcriptional regulator [Streptococcus suis 05ZYH33]
MRMKLDYRDYRSEIVEKFFIPLIVKEREEPIEADFSQKEKGIAQRIPWTFVMRLKKSWQIFVKKSSQVFVWGIYF